MRRANAALLLVTTLLCLVAAEAILRRLADRTEVRRPSGERRSLFNPYRADATLGYALRPGWSGIHESADFRVGVRVNELGMRGPDASATKPAGTRRILVLGDSFAFGWGVGASEMFPARLAERWRDAGDAVEVLDAAVPGYAADQHVIFLRERGFALAPDLLILALSQNDAEDLAFSDVALGDDRLPLRSASLRRFIAEDGRMHYHNESGQPLPAFAGSQRLAEHSLIYTYLRYNALRYWLSRAERATAQQRTRDAGPPPEGAIEDLAPDEIARGLRTGAAFQLRYHRFLVDAIRRDAASRGIAVVTVLIGLGPGLLSADCARDADCLDLSSQLARATNPDAYLPLDGHWSAHGHALAAAAIDAWLRDKPFGAAAP